MARGGTSQRALYVSSAVALGQSRKRNRNQEQQTLSERGERGEREGATAVAPVFMSFYYRDYRTCVWLSQRLEAYWCALQVYLGVHRTYDTSCFGVPRSLPAPWWFVVCCFPFSNSNSPVMDACLRVFLFFSSHSAPTPLRIHVHIHIRRAGRPQELACVGQRSSPAACTKFESTSR